MFKIANLEFTSGIGIKKPYTFTTIYNDSK